MAIGHCALSLQFHVEIAAGTVEEWGQIPTYKNALEKNLGVGALRSFKNQTDANMKGFNHCARTLYDNWKGLAFK